MKLDRSILDGLDFNPYYNVVANSEYIDLASNNYLGLSKNESVRQAAISAILEYGTSMCSTPIAAGYMSLFSSTEKRLAGFIALEDTILFPSCYQSNNGIFGVLCSDKDVIIPDRFSHSSLIQGVMSTKSKIMPFKHNDVEHLEIVLRRSAKYEKRFVVTESVFSTEGTIAPFDKITELCIKYDAIPVVDDSHGIGVIGVSGRGVLEHFGIENYKGIYTASLGKSLANAGGMVAGDAETIEYLRHLCPHLIYSTAITPATLGGINGALDVVENDFGKLSMKMWDYKRKIASASNKFLDSVAPINSIFAGSAKNALVIAKNLYENKILSTPFIEPSVPGNSCVVRLIAGAGLTNEQVDEACGVISKL